MQKYYQMQKERIAEYQKLKYQKEIENMKK